MEPKPSTPTWLVKLRELLKKRDAYYDNNDVIMDMLKHGDDEEEYMTKEFHKSKYGNCNCIICSNM